MITPQNSPISLRGEKKDLGWKREMFGVYCSRQDSRENYKHSVHLHGAARIGQSWVESQWREAYVIMSSKLAPISGLRELLRTGVWMRRWMGSHVKVLCGVCRQPLAAYVSRTLRVSKKPFDMPPRIIQAPTESWFYLLLPSTRFTPRSFNVAPSCLARHKALHTALV